jgi:hypothetical protein
MYNSCKAIEEFHQFKRVLEQPTLVLIPLFRSWHKIKCHICPSHCSSYGTADFGFGNKKGLLICGRNRSIQTDCIHITPKYKTRKEAFKPRVAITSIGLGMDSILVAISVSGVEDRERERMTIWGKLLTRYRSQDRVENRLARWRIFKPKILVWVNFGVSCNERCL